MDIGGPEDECRFEAEAEITLIGVREDSRDVERFGQKFIGVDEGGHLQIHGAKKLSWTRFLLRSHSLRDCCQSYHQTDVAFHIVVTVLCLQISHDIPLSLCVMEPPIGVLLLKENDRRVKEV